MRALLMALALGAAGLTAAAPADAQPGYGRHHDRGPGFDRGHHRGWDRPGYRRGPSGYGRHHYGRQRYSYYRHGRRHWGWR